MQNNPYEVLGVKESDSLEHIEHVYKQFMKLLHPDKDNKT
jgi:DnaJ-class molecular chaperone